MESGFEEEDKDDDVRQTWMKVTVKDKALPNKHYSGHHEEQRKNVTEERVEER